MKTTLLFFILLLPLFIYSQDEVDNDSPVEAPLVALPAGFWATIGPAAGDIDYYRIEIETPGVLEVLINNYTDATGGDLALEITCYAFDGTTLVGNSSEGYEGSDIQKEFVVDSGIYFLMINECYLTDNDLADPDPMFVNIQLDSDEFGELNNCFSRATEVPFDTSFYIRIYGENKLYPVYNDRDFFKVEIPVGGIFNIELLNDSPLSIEMRVYDGDTVYASMANSWEDFGPTNGITRTVVCPGTYYFYFFEEDNNMYGEDSLQINLSLDTSEICECNNTFDDAKYVPFDTTFVVKLIGTNFAYGSEDYDIDYFFLVAPCNGQIEITFENNSDITHGYFKIFNTDAGIPLLEGPSYPGGTGHSFYPGVTNDTSYFSIEYDGWGMSFDTILITTEIHPYTTNNIELSGDTSLCTGDEVLLMAEDTSATNYLWNTGDTTTFITVDTAGSFWLTIIDAGCTLFSDTVNISSHITPTAVITPGGPLAFCAGDSVTLYGSGGDILDWIPGPIGDSIVVDDGGTIQLKVTTEGCYDYASVYIDVFELPDPEIFTTDPVSFCPGEIAAIYTDYTNDFIWNTGATTDSIIVSESGVYFVESTDTNGCYGISNVISILTFPEPAIPIITLEDSILTSTIADAYQWYLDGVPIAGATDQTYIPIVEGIYYVEITDPNGCSTISSEFNFEFELAIDSNDGSAIIQAFPNPAFNEVTLYSDLFIDIGLLKIFDLTGKTVMASELSLPSVLDISKLDSGIYFLTFIYSDKILQSEPIIIH
ncbi:MAG: T9SS type A sorting domain-containing protein [Chitinophagales bacterium]